MNDFVHRHLAQEARRPSWRQEAHPGRGAGRRHRRRRRRKERGRLQPRAVEEQRRVGQPHRLVRGERRALAQQGTYVRLLAPLLCGERPHQEPHDGERSRRPHPRGQPRHGGAVRVDVDHYGPTPRTSVRHPGTLDPPQVRLWFPAC